MEDFLAKLNPRQREAASATEGCVRVIAGAGSGKTGTLTARYAYLAGNLGVSTAGILCVTFTNRAAAEMRTRIRRLLPDRDLGYITTFHGFCTALIKEDCHVLQYPRNFLVMDNEDKEGMLRTIFTEMGITARDMTVESVSDYIADFKGGHDYVPTLITMDPEQLLRLQKSASDLRDRVLYRYFYEQRKCYGLDFDDLLLVALYILRTDEESRNKWRSRLEYVMVDEFQDVDRDEYALAETLSEGHKNLFVVGDPDQTIYSWRGADPRFLLEFDLRHPGTRTIVLDVNYRSTPEILAAANTLIRCNRNRMEKDLHPVLPSGPRPRYFRARSRREEADWIAARLTELRDRGEPLASAAILYRAHYVSRPLEEALVRAKLPYLLYGGQAFYGRKEIKDVLSYLRMLTAGDDMSFVRTVNEPRRSFGRKRMEALRAMVRPGETLFETLGRNLDAPVFRGTGAGEYVSLIRRFREKAEHTGLTDLVSALLADSGYEEMLRLAGAEERLDNLSELKQSIFEYETGAGERAELADYLASVALFTDLDRTERRDAVKLMTVHTAKGLEFPRVFLAGLSEGIFPSKKALTPEMLEEERRLCYVALTRARQELTLSDAAGESYDRGYLYPSRFVFNVGKENLDYVRPLTKEEEESGRDASGPAQGALWQNRELPVGARVAHPVFGPGTVEGFSPLRDAYQVRFDSLDTPRSILASVLTAG